MEKEQTKYIDPYNLQDDNTTSESAQLYKTGRAYLTNSSTTSKERKDRKKKELREAMSTAPIAAPIKDRKLQNEIPATPVIASPEPRRADSGAKGLHWLKSAMQKDKEREKAKQKDKDKGKGKKLSSSPKIRAPEWRKKISKSISKAEELIAQEQVKIIALPSVDNDKHVDAQSEIEKDMPKEKGEKGEKGDEGDEGDEKVKPHVPALQLHNLAKPVENTEHETSVVPSIVSSTEQEGYLNDDDYDDGAINDEEKKALSRPTSGGKNTYSYEHFNYFRIMYNFSLLLRTLQTRYVNIIFPCKQTTEFPIVVCRICEQPVPLDQVEPHGALCSRFTKPQIQIEAVNKRLKQV